MASENQIAIGVMKIAAANAKTNICTFKQAYKQIPSVVKLSANNLAKSTTRPNEPMWHQLVRNIRSHNESYENFIAKGLLIHIPRVGYQITAKGKKGLNNKS